MCVTHCMQIIHGGNVDKSKGWFVEPTIVVTTNPKQKIIQEEIFGPILTIYVYEDADVPPSHAVR